MGSPASLGVGPFGSEQRTLDRCHPVFDLRGGHPFRIPDHEGEPGHLSRKPDIAISDFAHRTHLDQIPVVLQANPLLIRLELLHQYVHPTMVLIDDQLDVPGSARIMTHPSRGLVRQDIPHQGLVAVGRVEYPVVLRRKAENRDLTVGSVFPARLHRVLLFRKARRCLPSDLDAGPSVVVHDRRTISHRGVDHHHPDWRLGMVDDLPGRLHEHHWEIAFHRPQARNCSRLGVSGRTAGCDAEEQTEDSESHGSRLRSCRCVTPTYAI